MVDISSYEPYLKQYYNSYSPYNVTYESGPFYAMMMKATRAGGKNMPVPQQYGNPQSTSSSFSVSSGSANSAIQLAEFLIPSYPKMYSMVNIDEDLIAASRNDEFTFQQALTNSIDSTIREHGKFLAIYFTGDGSCAIGQVDTNGVSGSTITLVDPTHARRFSVGQSVYTAAAKFSTEPTNEQLITAVDSINGTITFDSLPTGTDDDWYLFNEGDYATSLGSKIVGYQGWVPPGLTSPWTTLFSTDRSVNPSLLAGVPLNGQNMTPKQAMIQAVQNLVANGVNPASTFKIFLHPIQYAVLLQSLEANRVYTIKDTEISGLNISFRGINYVGAGYSMDVYQDMWIDSDKMFICDFDKFRFENSAHAAMFTSDGLDLLRLPTADAVQLRIRTYGQIACSAVARQAIVYNLAKSL